MKNIYVLPTHKPSRLIHNDANQLCYQSNKSAKNDRKWIYRKKFNIHITNDEKIKFDDYITDGYIVWQLKNNISLLNKKKVILTTDQDLIKDGVQSIDNEFLEWFIKNPSCEEVEVVDNLKYFNVDELRERHLKELARLYSEKIGYKTILPKEDSKIYTKDDYFNDEFPKKEPFKHKFRVIPKEEVLANRCSAYEFIDFDKQKTLEEAAEYYAHNYFDMHETNNYKVLKKGFIEGAKWQQEISFSEEEVNTLITLLKSTTEYEVLQSFRDKVQQFKKK